MALNNHRRARAAGAQIRVADVRDAKRWRSPLKGRTRHVLLLADGSGVFESNFAYLEMLARVGAYSKNYAFRRLVRGTASC